MRVTLRQPSPADGPELIQANIRSCALHTPWVEPFTDQKGFDEWFEQKSGDNHKAFLAIETANNNIAGIINLNEIVRRSFQCAFLGFYALVPYDGKGLMTDALQLVARYAFDELGLHRLEANIQPGNSRSIALVKRLGFRKEGFSPRYLKVGSEWRDHERWAIVAEEDANLQ